MAQSLVNVGMPLTVMTTLAWFFRPSLRRGPLVVRNSKLFHPEKINKGHRIEPFLPGPRGFPWLDFREASLGGGDDYYFAHVNQQRGVAAAVRAESATNSLTNLYRK